MAKRILIALVILLAGAAFATVMAMVATNGYTSIADAAVAGYLVLGIALVLLLGWLAAAASQALSRRLHWPGWLTLPLMLIPALLIELIGLVILAVVLAELASAMR